MHSNFKKGALVVALSMSTATAHAGIFDKVGNWFKGIFEDAKDVAEDVKDKLVDVTQDGIFYIDNGLELVKGFAKGVANTSNGAVINHQDVTNYQNSWTA